MRENWNSKQIVNFDAIWFCITLVSFVCDQSKLCYSYNGLIFTKNVKSDYCHLKLIIDDAKIAKFHFNYYFTECLCFHVIRKPYVNAFFIFSWNRIFVWFSFYVKTQTFVNTVIDYAYATIFRKKKTSPYSLQRRLRRAL